MRRVADVLASGGDPGMYVTPMDVFSKRICVPARKTLAGEWLPKAIEARDPNVHGPIRDPFTKDSLWGRPAFSGNRAPHGTSHLSRAQGPIRPTAGWDLDRYIRFHAAFMTPLHCHNLLKHDPIWVQLARIWSVHIACTATSEKYRGHGPKARVRALSWALGLTMRRTAPHQRSDPMLRVGVTYV